MAAATPELEEYNMVVDKCNCWVASERGSGDTREKNKLQGDRVAWIVVSENTLFSGQPVSRKHSNKFPLVVGFLC